MAPPPSKSAQLLASPTSVESSLPYRTQHTTRRTLSMSSSSRAQIYRRRIRHKTRRLIRDGREIQRQLRNLEIIVQVQRHLHTRLPQTRTRQRILAHVGDFVVNAKYLQGQDLLKHELEVRSIDCYGSAEAPILRMDATLRGSYAQSTIERLYAAVPGNATLLDHLMHERMVFACSFVFCFSVDGSVEFETIETDYVRGLVPSSSNLRDVRALLIGLLPPQSTGIF